MFTSCLVTSTVQRYVAFCRVMPLEQEERRQVLYKTLQDKSFSNLVMIYGKRHYISIFLFFSFLFYFFLSFTFFLGSDSFHLQWMHFSFQYGDVMMTAGASGQTGLLQLPAPSVTADCMDTNPAGNYYSLYCGAESPLLNCGNCGRVMMLTHVHLRTVLRQVLDIYIR